MLSLRLLFCRLFQNPQFILVVRDGRVSKYMGEVRVSLVADCQEVVERNNVRSGFIYSVNGKFGVNVLKGSGEIPPTVLQQLRNVANF